MLDDVKFLCQISLLSITRNLNKFSGKELFFNLQGDFYKEFYSNMYVPQIIYMIFKLSGLKEKFCYRIFFFFAANSI